MDVAETSRAAKAMVENFGIAAEDAFDYIAKGAQDGLDYSGELLDNISEYSVQFKSWGFLPTICSPSSRTAPRTVRGTSIRSATRSRSFLSAR